MRKVIQNLTTIASAPCRQHLAGVATGLMHLHKWPVAAALWFAALATLGVVVPAAAQPAPRVWVTPPPGDVARGAVLYQAQCTACHAVDNHQTGPAHRGVMGRRLGSAPGYTYSDELARSRLRWTPQTLNLWLEDPEELVAGQRMGFRVDNARERADLIAYLATLK